MAPRSAILALTFALLVAVVLSEGPQCGLLSLEYDDYNDVDDDEGNRGSNSGSSGGRNGRSNSGSSGGNDPTTATTAASATPPPGALSVPTTGISPCTPSVRPFIDASDLFSKHNGCRCLSATERKIPVLFG